MKNLFSKEAALIVGLLQTLIVLAVAFGLELSVEQQGALLAALAAVAALLTRSEVYSQATVEELTQDTINRSASPDLLAEAARYAKYLPQPVGIILEAGGVAALEVAVETVKKALQRPLTPDEAKERVKAEVVKRG